MALFKDDMDYKGRTGASFDTEYEDEKPSAYSYKREYNRTPKEVWIDTLRMLATIGKNTAGVMLLSSLIAAPVGVVLYSVGARADTFVALVSAVSMGATIAGVLRVKDLRAKGQAFYLLDEFDKHSAALWDKIIAAVKRKNINVK